MKRRGLWLTVGTLVLCLIVLIPACLMTRSKTKPRFRLPKERLPTMAVSNAVLRLERFFGPAREGLKIVRVDAHGITALKFREALLSVAGKQGVTTVWMPGVEDWLVVHDTGNMRLAEVMDRMAEEGTSDTLGGLFASYVGELSDVMPAFSTLPPETRVTPANFVMREVRDPRWLDWTDVEPDVRKVMRDQMRSAQVVRRMILKGDMFMREEKLSQAIATWSRAAKRHREDPLLQERLEHLRTNAEVFFRLGRPGMAAKCWQTVSLICPNDANAFFQFGLCADKLGQKDVAKKAFAKARQLREARRGTAKDKPQAQPPARFKPKGKPKRK